MSTDHQQEEPCLVVKPDKLRQYLLQLCPRKSDLTRKKLADMVSNPTIHVVQGASGGIRDKEEKAMFDFALALKSHQCLEAIHFKDCQFNDFSHVYLATTIATKSQDRLRLEFQTCKFGPQAAKVLQFMLQSQVLSELVFHNCTFGDDSANAIEYGLPWAMLRTFECTFDEVSSFKASPINGVQGMLNDGWNIKKLNLTVNDSDFWLVFKYAMDNKTLESLCFYATDIDIESMECILMKCFSMKSLTELGFRKCDLTDSALDLLVKTLCCHQILDSLILDNVEVALSDGPQARSCGEILVTNLCLKGTKLCEEDEFESLVMDFLNNASIKCLDLISGPVESDEGYGDICNHLLLRNRGPRELIINIYPSVANRVKEAFQRNSSVTSLTIHGMCDSCLSVFAAGVAHMAGLRKLSFHLTHDDEDEDDENAEPFFQALERSLEENTTLQTLSIVGSDDDLTLAQRYLPKIQYFLAINRLHRHRLFTETVPVGVWAHVLAKTANEAAGINFVLRGMPEIVAPSRKRKDRNGDS
jgi:hypothetical protein